MIHDRIRSLGGIAALIALVSLAAPARAGDDPWVVYDGFAGPGEGKHIVFVTGDDEYRSEESMPMIAKVLAVHHGFKCTVLFAIKDGVIQPDHQTNIPGLAALDDADLMVIFTRFRSLPDEDMKHIVDFADSGKPIIGIRTSTHAFNIRGESQYSKYTWNNGDAAYRGGFGRQVLGETWISHYGGHKTESTRGIVVESMKDHPVLRGVTDVWGPMDVYGITQLEGDAQPVLLGAVLKGMTPQDEPNPKKPAIPVAWVKSYTGGSGEASRVFCVTMGGSKDFESEGLRRLLVNACYWGLEMEDVQPEKANVDTIGTYDPTEVGFGTFAKGVKPADHRLRLGSPGKD